MQRVNTYSSLDLAESERQLCCALSLRTEPAYSVMSLRLYRKCFTHSSRHWQSNQTQSSMRKLRTLSGGNARDINSIGQSAERASLRAAELSGIAPVRVG